MKVLIVEDAPLVQKMYGLVFPGQKHALTHAGNGHQALNALERSQGHQDVILLDLQMPDMNGVDFLRALRAEPRFGQIPVIVTTMEPDESELLKQATALGVAAVVKKPWRPHALRTVIESVLHTPIG